MHNGPVTTDPDIGEETLAPTAGGSVEPALQLCSQAARSSGDDPAGTAAAFSSFLLLDHRQAWSANAAEDAVARLAPEAAAAVNATPGLRAFAIRNVQPRSTTDFPAAFGGVAGPDGHLVRWARRPEREQLQELLQQPKAQQRSNEQQPLFGVCTNGRRDRCCAIVGRGIAVGLHADFGDRVVEISHLGGHRYAGTMLVLPWGYAYGFLDLAGASAIAAAAYQGLVHPDGLRGRADLAPVAQAADVLLRREIGPAAPAAVRILGVEQKPNAPGAHRVRAEVLGEPCSVLMRRTLGSTVELTVCGGKPFSTGSWTMARL